jgi:hypothetical protein
MSILCFLPNLTSSEWAAWVQAIGSIAAIIGAAWIAIWQSRKQHKSSLELLRTEHKLVRIEVAQALSFLSSNAQRLLNSYTKELSDREFLHKVAERKIYYDLNELKIVEGAVHSMPLHEIPHQLVGLRMLAHSAIRQFRENIEKALEIHSTMNAAEFGKFFSVLSEIQKSLKHYCDEIQMEVTKLEKE